MQQFWRDAWHWFAAIGQMVAHSTAESPDISKKMAERNLKRNFQFFFYVSISFIYSWVNIWAGCLHFPCRLSFFFVSWKKLMHSNQMAIRPIECQPNVIFKIYLINFILTELIGIILEIWCNFLKMVKLILIRSMNFFNNFLNKLQFNVRSQWIE